MEKKQYKYSVFFPVLKGLGATKIKEYKELVTKHAESNSLKLHISLHGPLRDVNEEHLVGLIKEYASLIGEKLSHPTNYVLVQTGYLENFNDTHFVLPLYLRTDNGFLLEIINKLRTEISPKDYNEWTGGNVLHITLGKTSADLFEKTWNKIERKKIKGVPLQLYGIEICRKELNKENAKWEPVEYFSFVNY